MQANVHTPELLSGESQADYRSRRAASKRAARQTVKGSYTQGQHTNPERCAVRKARRESKAIARAQFPKFPTVRVHKQHKHPLCDEHGAVTLIGRPVELIGVAPTSRDYVIEGGSDHGERFYMVRRIWLAGISAMRGY